ncbi:hypothetical protein QNI16_14965 [Cytophagaceae bacterium YF14B1]|uniref:Lipoprotein n=1 Tax=Xanthocytophaga flava TaxID=3048013 RepID=A0AAE3U6F7_9BACT|nr:hypothetical protein [Xanthocytophaga flavus]MDJ1481799.1 hypothetical protein [Xanthocytophaga flavus]
MKKLPYVFLVLLLAVAAIVACSRTQKTDKTTSAQLRTHKEAVDTLRGSEEAQAAQPAQPLEIIPENNSEVLASNDLSALFHRTKEYDEPAVYNGFYGTDHYRIEMYFASVTKDATHPNVYHIEGKSRYKRNITPFHGEIVLEEAVQFRDPNISEANMKEMEIKNTYMTHGTFKLLEDSTFTGSGVFSGKVAIDFATKTNNGIRQWYFSETKEGAQGAGFIFDGKWVSYKTGKSKPITWARDIFMIADGILKDFSIGERDVEINPKYRKLGWDNFWENDEWWNENPSAKL